MATLTVLPRRTPAEKGLTEVDVQVDEELTVFAAQLEDWSAPRQSWQLELREGHEFGRANNIEVQLLFSEGEQTSSLTFRIDQLESVDDSGQELVLIFEEKDGIAKLATCTAKGIDLELFHILTFT
jgi:hypothetical protein